MWLFLVSQFGNVNPEVTVTRIEPEKFRVEVSAPRDVESVNIKTKNGVALFTAIDTAGFHEVSSVSAVSFAMKAGTVYSFLVEGETGLTAAEISIIDQKRGYSHSIYLMSVFLALFMFITFFTTRERVKPPKDQKTDLKQDLKDLVRNKPWIVLLVIGLLFNVYNSIKQGIVVIYFTHYLNNQLLAGSYLVGLMVASIAGAMVTGYLGRKMGKRNLFIAALIFSGIVNALLIFCNPGDIYPIFALGMVSEFASAIFPTLFFAMLGDAADFS